MNRLMLIAASILAVSTFGVQGQAADKASTASAGKHVYDHWCAPCHDAGRAHHPGTGALAFKYKGENIPAALEQRTDLTPDVIKTFVRNGVSVMPMFRKTEISDAQLDALAAYLSHQPVKSPATKRKAKRPPT
jgi:mono/diheme cytochrome c family protein